MLATIILIQVQFFNYKILDRMTGLKSGGKPAWLFSTS